MALVLSSGTVLNLHGRSALMFQTNAGPIVLLNLMVKYTSLDKVVELWVLTLTCMTLSKISGL